MTEQEEIARRLATLTRLAEVISESGLGTDGVFAVVAQLALEVCEYARTDPRSFVEWLGQLIEMEAKERS